MFRFTLLMFLSTGVYAAQSIDIETAARIYQEAAMREQVRARWARCLRTYANCSPPIPLQSSPSSN